ncbi:DUF6961 family protein [Sphingomonas colocasiae]|uniref:Uncharacterized protein n=1 Tax=Sphingomonas colocasiae TaxID=1848973 RepID=A0ABS7PQC2_9SPHN|nr:hypothetical protein [Sphingomonas colocasiae]MBY8823446.1 hypothetical protein [Sphingomonas colocasiae]
MTPEQERWAFAGKLIEIHGDDVMGYIARRVADLSRTQDELGVRFWIDITDKVRQLAGPSTEVPVQ